MSEFNEDNVQEAEVVEVAEKTEQTKTKTTKQSAGANGFNNFINGFGLVNLLACASIFFALFSTFLGLCGVYQPWRFITFGLLGLFCFAGAFGFYVFKSIRNKQEFKFNLNAFLLVVAMVFMLMSSPVGFVFS